MNVIRGFLVVWWFRKAQFSQMCDLAWDTLWWWIMPSIVISCRTCHITAAYKWSIWIKTAQRCIVFHILFLWPRFLTSRIRNSVCCYFSSRHKKFIWDECANMWVDSSDVVLIIWAHRITHCHRLTNNPEARSLSTGAPVFNGVQPCTFGWSQKSRSPKGPKGGSQCPTGPKLLVMHVFINIWQIHLCK